MCFIITPTTKEYILKRNIKVYKKVYEGEDLNKCHPYYQNFSFTYKKDKPAKRVVLLLTKTDGSCFDNKDASYLESCGYERRSDSENGWYRATNERILGFTKGYHFFTAKTRMEFVNALFIIPAGTRVFIDKKRQMGVAEQITFIKFL